MVPISRSFLSQPKDLQEFIRLQEPDYIFHLAAAGNHSNQKDEQQIFEANVVGTWNMLMASKDVPYKLFVYFSTSSVDLPYETFYSATKASCERIIKAFVNEYEKPIVIVRPFSVYGPGEADFRFIPTVCRALITGEKMPLDPDPVHDWIYIDDVIEAILLIIERREHIGSIVEIGTEKQTKNIEIAVLLTIIANKELQYVFERNMRVYDSSSWKADISELVLHKWEPKYTLEEGLRKTYEWYTKERFNNK
mgnify:FL=1